MSHVYFVTRGRMKNVRKFVEDMEDIFFPYKVPNPDGKMTDGMVQAVPRPIQLWELVIPEESEMDMLAMLEGHSAPSNGKMEFLAKAIRKGLGLKPIPKKILSNKLPLPRVMVSTHLIGIKKDKRSSLGQEML